MELNPNKCELIGLHTGDGTLYKTTRGKVWELRGDVKEREFYDKYISKLLYKIFKVEFKPKYRAGPSYGIQTCNKELIEFLISTGFPIGTKTYTVEVPDYIFKSTTKNKLAFLRGLFDTDGCINFYREYPRIELGFASVKLRNSLNALLKELGFRTCIWEFKSVKKGTLCYCYKVRIFGKEQAKKFFKEVSPKNTKHLNKYLNWKKNAEVA